MKDLKLELFNFKKKLTIEQDDISRIVEGYTDALNDLSEKQIILSLNEKLKPYTFDKETKLFLESLNGDMREYELLYELKNLYNVLNSQNQGEIYRQPITVLLQTINLDSDQDRMSKVLNELAVYDWVPEIKLFVHNLSKSPEQRSNLLSGGKSETVYTLAEQVENGHICFIRDAWFLLKEDCIEKTLLESNITDPEKLRIMRTLETALQWSTITEDRVSFRISENLTIGLSVSDKSSIFINDEKMGEETPLENLFQSPIVPLVNKNFYPLLVEVSKNLDKFVELDVVKKVYNMSKPFLEVFAFNYKDSTYLYRCDERYGFSFYKYEKALDLVNEAKSDLGYDLTYFYEDKLSKEIVVKKKLEDKEREITLKLEDVTFNIEKVKNSIQYVNESKILKDALTNLEKRKSTLSVDLQVVKEMQIGATEKLI